MKHMIRLIIPVLVLASLFLSACGSKPPAQDKVQPAQLEPIEGSSLKSVLLTEKAAERIDIQTAGVVIKLVNGIERQVVPYAAVIYDTDGNTWVYTNTAPLTFVRAPIEVAFIEGDEAFLLSEGLVPEARVVTVGVAELYGAETGVSK
jgi:uncharacterized protein YcfL